MISEVEVWRNCLSLDMKQQIEKGGSQKCLHRNYRKFGIISKYRKTLINILAKQRNQWEVILLNPSFPKATDYACAFWQSPNEIMIFTKAYTLSPWRCFI